MTRRGDGIGLEVLPGEIRGARLEQDAPGRVAAVACIKCDTADDAALRAGLISAYDALGAAGMPTRACAWLAGSQLQSIDITGLSAVEVNVHRSTLDGTAATMEVIAGPRRLLVHVRADIAWWVRVEQAVQQAGFDLDTLEPTPVAIARLITGPGVQLTAQRDGAEAWVAVVHDRALLAAVPCSPAAPRRKGADLAELSAAAWAGSPDELRERLLGPEDLARLVAAGDGATVEPALHLVNEPYPEFPEADVVWGPRLAGSLGAAVAAAGIAGRVFPLELMPTSRALFEDVGAWVVERVGDVEPERPDRPRRRWF